MKIIKTKSFEIAANTEGDDDSSKIAILMPGRLDTKDYANFVSHAEYLAKGGFFVAAIDPPGTWDSPGGLANYSTSSYLQAVNELIDYFGNRPTLLLGHSRGGATAMLASSSNPAITGLILVNAAYGNPSSPDPKKIENGALPEYRDIPPGDIRTKEQRRFDLPLTYFKDGAKHNPLEALAQFKGPKLLVHATEDEFKPSDVVRGIYDGLSEPKMFLEIDCTHDYRLFPEVIQSVNQTIGQFLDNYLAD